VTGQVAGKGGIPGKYARLDVGLELYDLESDIGETTNLAARKPEVVRQLEEKADRSREELGDSLRKRVGRGIRPPDRAPDQESAGSSLARRNERPTSPKPSRPLAPRPRSG